MRDVFLSNCEKNFINKVVVEGHVRLLFPNQINTFPKFGYNLNPVLFTAFGW